MPSYTLTQMDSLEMEAEDATMNDLRTVLPQVVNILRAAGIAYAVMGGFAMSLRGQSRTTKDVDCAVAGRVRDIVRVLPSYDTTALNIYYPATAMQYATGALRIFVVIPQRTRLVEFDLLQDGADGFRVSGGVAANTEEIGGYAVLALGPQVAAKLKAFEYRDGENDYEDLVFLCTQEMARVRAIASTLSSGGRRCFIDTVCEREGRQSTTLAKIVHALQMRPSTAEPSSGSGSNAREGGGGWSSRTTTSSSSQQQRSGGGSSSHTMASSSQAHREGRSSSSTPRDGDRNGDWTYNARYGRWWRRRSNGETVWS